MNDLQIFNNPEFGKIRIIEIGGEPWFVGKDVSEALGYRNPRQALATNVDEDDRGVHSVDTPSGIQEMTIINESGVYSLIFSSKLPSAKKFKRWVTSEVLPSIRKNGTYSASARLILPEGVSLSGLARLISTTRRAMLDAGSTPLEVCSMIKETYQAVGFPVPSVFPKQLPGQMSLFDRPVLEA